MNTVHIAKILRGYFMFDKELHIAQDDLQITVTKALDSWTLFVFVWF